MNGRLLGKLVTQWSAQVPLYQCQAREAPHQQGQVLCLVFCSEHWLGTNLESSWKSAQLRTSYLQHRSHAIPQSFLHTVVKLKNQSLKQGKACLWFLLVRQCMARNKGRQTQAISRTWLLHMHSQTSTQGKSRSLAHLIGSDFRSRPNHMSKESVLPRALV